MNVLANSAGGIVAFGLDTFGLGRTPVAILLVVLLLTVIAIVFFGGLSQVGAKFVDKRWPADEPLTPAELLWGETGSYVGKTFPGLDPVIAHDLSQYISSKKVKPGESIIEAGDLPTEFVLIKSGDVEVFDPRQPGPVAAKAGASFGSEAILRRQPHAFTVRAKNAVELLSLPAEDYLAGLVLGAQRGEDRFVLNQLSTYLAEPGLGMQGAPQPPQQGPGPQGPGRQGPGPQGPGRQGPGPQGPGPQGPQGPGSGPPQQRPGPSAGPQPPPSPGSPQFGQGPPAPPARSQPQWPEATHLVGFVAVPGYSLPAGQTPSRMLPAGLPLAAYEQLPGWLHVRSIDGWDGWVADSGLTRLR